MFNVEAEMRIYKQSNSYKSKSDMMMVPVCSAEMIFKNIDKSLIDWLIDSLIDWLIYWLIDWSIDLLIDWLIDW